MIIFQIEQRRDGLRVELVSATEMCFEVAADPAEDCGQLIRDLCHLAPALMDADVDLIDAHDGATVRPKPSDLETIGRFVDTYRSRIRRASVPVGAFAAL